MKNNFAEFAHQFDERIQELHSHALEDSLESLAYAIKEEAIKSTLEVLEKYHAWLDD